MKVSRVIVAPFLALALISTSACSTLDRGRSDLRACTEYEDEVLDLDDEGECYAPDDDKKKKPAGVIKSKPKKKSSFGGTSKKSSTTKSTTRKK